MKKILSIVLGLLLLAAPTYATCSLWSGNTYTCLSSDTKPAATNGSRLYETDTRKEYLRAAGAWNEVTDPAKQVTGGNTHDHTLGAGAQVKHSELSEIGTNTHSEIDTGIVRVNWLDQADTDRFCSGVVAGGTITPTSGNLFTIAAGDGYINDHTTGKSHVVWTEKTSVATIGNGSNYIAIDADGNANVSLTKQAQGSYVRLGHVYAAAGNTVILETWNVPDWAIHLQGRLNDFIGEGIGVLVEGTTVSEKTTPNFLELNIASGIMRDRLGMYVLGSTSTFSSLYHTSDYDWVPDTATPNHVNTTQYNNYSGTYGGTALATMADTYWKKDIIVRVPSGTVFYIMAQTQYATEDEARAAGIPTLPPSVSEDTAKIATIISQKNDTTIATGIYDVRPNIDRIMGYGTGAGGAATDHATLTHLLFSESGHYGTLDGDWLPALSPTKRGGVAATGTPSGKYYRDDDTWQTISAGGAPTTSTYTTVTDETATLTNSRRWVNGTNTTVDTGTAGQIKINSTVGADLSGMSFITNVAETSLSNEFALGGLATGLLKNTITTGVPTIATSGTDYGPPTSGNATGLVISTTGTGAHTAYAGTSCTNMFARSLSASGVAACAGIGVADFTANQGTTTQVLHGNAAGQPSWTAITSADLPTSTVAKGGTNLTTIAAHQMLIGTATDTYTAKTIPDCSNATLSKMMYTQSTDVWSCGTDQTSGGASAFTITGLAADVSNSTTTGAKITGLDTVVGVGTYTFQYYIRYWSSVITTGVKFSVNHTGTVTAFFGNVRFAESGVAAATNNPKQNMNAITAGVHDSFSFRAKSTLAGIGPTISVDTINADMLMIIEGMLIVTVSGNIELWHGSETANSTTIKAGSSLVLTKVL